MIHVETLLLISILECFGFFAVFVLQVKCGPGDCIRAVGASG